MGSDDPEATDAEKPVHPVTLSSYSIGKYEVTQKLWEAVMGSNPSVFKGENLPVENVSWNDVQEFLRKLNEMTGKQYRLPTEAEWEFAARGGNLSKGYKYSGSDNPDMVAWHSGNSDWKTQPVGTKAPNELGIYDMSGNVEEWCEDLFDFYNDSDSSNDVTELTIVYINNSDSSDNEAEWAIVDDNSDNNTDYLDSKFLMEEISVLPRVVRGGSWFFAFQPRACRLYYRYKSKPDYRNYTIGFRLAL